MRLKPKFKICIFTIANYCPGFQTTQIWGIHLGPIFATRKAVAPFSNIQSSWADQYGSIDTWNIKIRPLVTILWPNILGDQQEPWTPSLLPYLIEITARTGPAALYCTLLHSSVLYCIKREGWKRENEKICPQVNKE